jgi:hypothetical protein
LLHDSPQEADMDMVVLGLMQDPHQARGAVRALDAAGFEREEIDSAGELAARLSGMGVPPDEADDFAEAARRGGTLVCVCTDGDAEAERAADIMAEHGALDIEACAAGWEIESTTLVAGEVPAGRGRMYRDPRTRPSPSVRTPGVVPGERYRGPERRMRDQPYVGINRRAV